MEKVKEIFKKNIMIILMNIIIFSILFFILPLPFKYINTLWKVLFVLTIALITDIFYLTGKIKYEQVLISLPILFILNLIFIKYATIRDLYGITSHGALDKTPAIVDALLIDMVIVFTEYVTLFITRFIKKLSRKEKI